MARSLDEHTQSLVNYLPGGRLFRSANVSNSNFRGLLKGLAGELLRCDRNIRLYLDEILPDKTVIFIDEWERALGIPDSCFPGTGTVDQRRLHVLIKLASLGVQTNSDFVALGALFGVTVTIESGSVSGIFPMTFPIVLFDSAREAYFTIFVTFTVPAASRFPLTFPFIFGSSDIAILECLFNKLKPANCNVIFKQV